MRKYEERHGIMGEEKKPVSGLISELRTDAEKGLTAVEAALRLDSYGRNELAPKKKRSALHSLLAFLREPMIWLLAGAGIIYYLLGETLDAAIVLVAIVPLAAIDIFLDYQAESALEKLKQRASPKVLVLRDGREEYAESAEIVPGDVFFLSEGSIVPADAVILESSDLRADESALTGESVPLDKHVVEYYSEEFFGNDGVLFAGTTIVGGRARCFAFRIGRETAYGRIGTMISEVQATRTPLQKNIDGIVEVLGLVALGLSAALFLTQFFLAGKPWTAAFLDAVSLAIAAIPEEFPVTFALFLSLGALALAQKNALVKRLLGVETLGSVDIICTDKTGTLTEGRMALASLAIGGQVVDSAAFNEKGGRGERDELVRAAVLACEKKPFDEMEKAVFEFARATANPEKIQGEWKLVHEYPFDHHSKSMSHIWKKGGVQAIFAKGSVEGILAKCAIGEKERREALRANEAMAARGMRMLALASRPLKKISGRASDEKGMSLLALLGFTDPVRMGVPEAIEDCTKAGIRVVMITGDHKATAKAVALETGISNPFVVEGSQLARLGGAGLVQAVQKANVFSRALPEHKLLIVETLQKLGSTVAVTGDGINDAPALKKADIGIAMGLRGTEVSREAAAMVLMDDNFVTIVEAMRNGRAIYDNLKKAFAYLVAFHIPIFLSALAIPLLGFPLLLMPVHIIFLEMFLHPAVSIVFQQEPADEDVMRRPPRKRTEPLINSALIGRLVFAGIALFLVTLAAYMFEMHGGEKHARSAAFTVLLFGQVFLMAGELAGEKPLRFGPMLANKTLWIISIAAVALWLAMGSFAITQDVFSITPLNAEVVLAALGVSAVPLFLSECWKLISARRAAR